MSKMKIKLHESFSETTLFYGKDGLVVMNPAYPGIFAYYMLDEDGKSDDCTYYFKLEDSRSRLSVSTQARMNGTPISSRPSRMVG